MRKKMILILFIFTLMHLCTSRLSWADSIHSLCVTGAVSQPLYLTLEELNHFQTASLRLIEVTRDGNFQGSFYYRGVPLKAILDLACVQKEEVKKEETQKKMAQKKMGLARLQDLAITVKNRDGRQIVLSWGEVFYRNPDEVILALSATPIRPDGDCSHCHAPEVCEKWLTPLDRQVKFPRLVVGNDFYADRSLEEVTLIEVVEVKPAADLKAILPPPAFTVTGAVKNALTINLNGGYVHREILVKQVGEGMGFHGLRKFEGVALREIIEQAGVDFDLNTLFLLSAAQGGHSVLSYGELFLTPAGERVIIADRDQTLGKRDQTLGKRERFKCIFPDDLTADRWVSELAEIEVIQLKPEPKLYIIGMGCADSSLLTLEAISYLARLDALVCSDEIRQSFARYLGHKPVLFDPMTLIPYRFNQKHSDLSPEEIEKAYRAEQAKAARMIKEALSRGQEVGFLDRGDPFVYGNWRWLKDYFNDREVEAVPGISAFNAANAIMVRDIGCRGSIVMTYPDGMKNNRAIVKAVAQGGDTLVIFMGLEDLEQTMPRLKEVYPGTTPLCLVYRAGYEATGKLIRTTLDQAVEASRKEQEKWLGMIYLGPCLNQGESGLEPEAKP